MSIFYRGRHRARRRPLFVGLVAMVAALFAIGGCTSASDHGRFSEQRTVPTASTSATPRAVKGLPTPTATKKATAKPERKRTAEPKPAAKSYSNCASMRRDFPNGVPSGHGSYSRRLDRDRDGRACER